MEEVYIIFYMNINNFYNSLLNPDTVILTVLSAWFRLKYPHIAIGALASSAPILQFDNITPSSSFYYGVSKDFKVATKLIFSSIFHLYSRICIYYLQDESLNCFDVIRECWDELMAMEDPKGLRKLSRAIKSCRY